MTNVALANSDIEGDSFTKTHKTYFIEDQSAGSKYAFAFNDTVGLEESGGVNKQDILLVLKGHVRDGYKFNSESPLSEDDPYYNNSPSLEDKVHCLVTVLATDKLSFMPKELISKLRDIRLEASDMGIPQVVLLTRVDEACELVKKDVRNVYTSKYIKQQIEKCSALLGTPMNCILPVKNYHNEPELINDLDELLLKALKHIINFANDYVTACYDRGHKQEYKPHYTEDRSSPGSSYAFAFIDIMRLEESGGVDKRDVDLLLKGHVKHGYQFNHESPLSEGDPYYNSSPCLGDKVHCLVTVAAADKLSLMPQEVISKLTEIQLEARNLGKSWVDEGKSF
ncbi:hypothetical protein MATL_G00074070 [Megalops atlanticus]|uniref:Interferon-induced protein 44-like n=1 Tax=Megalops atlanticus TaxID=7932 RepID=A0A9D3TC87_MEGAT|nr:hypothetical protein MATL_G00074070 [Megalops atlanticus]